MKFFINTKNVKKNGKVTIYLIVHVNYKTVQINTKVETFPEMFDLEKGRIQGRSQKVKDDNLILDNCKKLVTEILVKYRLENKPLTASILIDEYKNPSRFIDFYKFLKETINDRYKHNEIAEGTKDHHFSLLNKLKLFKKELAFSEITSNLIDDYSRYCRSTLKNKQNTINSDLRRWRRYMNIAKRKGVIDKNPFDEVSIKKVKTSRQHLTEPELMMMHIAYIEGEIEGVALKPHEIRTLRHFLFMCYTGLRVGDFFELDHKQIRENSIFLLPSKTDYIKEEIISIPLIENARALIKDEGTLEGVVFNTISEQKFRTQIKALVNKLNIDKNIALHTARHTFGTLFYEKTKNVVALQKILGHSRIEETMIYVHMNKEVINEEMQAFEESLCF